MTSSWCLKFKLLSTKAGRQWTSQDTKQRKTWCKTECYTWLIERGRTSWGYRPAEGKWQIGGVYMNIPRKHKHSLIERTLQAALDSCSEHLGCRCTLLNGTSAQVLPAQLPTTVKPVLLWQHALKLLTPIDFHPKVAKRNSKYPSIKSSIKSRRLKMCFCYSWLNTRWIHTPNTLHKSLRSTLS